MTEGKTGVEVILLTVSCKSCRRVKKADVDKSILINKNNVQYLYKINGAVRTSCIRQASSLKHLASISVCRYVVSWQCNRPTEERENQQHDD